MSYTFYTREQVADVLSRIGKNNLAERYLNNTTRRVVVTENPVKNSFDWRGTTEGFDFWKAISSAFDAAIASGEVSVVGNPLSEKKAFTILERDVEHNPLDFLSPEFAVASTSSDDEAAAFIKKLLGITDDVSEDEDEDDEDEDEDDDFSDMPTPSDKTSSEKFAEEMAQYVVREAIKRSLIKSKK